MTTFKQLGFTNIENVSKMMQDFYAIDNYPIDVEQSKKLLEEFINNVNLGKCWLIYHAKEQGIFEIVGYVILTFVFSFEYKGKIAFLDELYVKEEFRRKGIGKQTLDFIKMVSQDLSLKLIYLEVENHNQNAQKLYLANDFEVHNRKLLKHKLN